MKKISTLPALAAAAYLAFAVISGLAQDSTASKQGANGKQQANANNDLGYDDTPMLPGLPYRVHAINRPHPRVVTPADHPGGPPSDAIVLFDGRDLSHWRAAGRGGVMTSDNPAPWKVGDGFFEAARFLNMNGRLCVGSDSQSTVNPAEELRWLEYRKPNARRCWAFANPSPQQCLGSRIW